MTAVPSVKADVLVIGGGATGAGVAWDAALRGFDVVLVERGDLAEGTSGRFHGLLHSGGRYVVKDPVAAEECVVENAILREVIPDCIEDTGGLFVTTPDDDSEYGDRFLEGCRKANLPAEEIGVDEALRREPRLNPGIKRAFTVPDASIDAWKTVWSFARGAAAHGARILTYHRVTDLHVDGGAVAGARVRNELTGEDLDIEAGFVLNASGAWAAQILHMAGIEDVGVIPGKGIMIAMNHRLVNTVINRCTMPADGDILVPVRTVSVIGTTDVRAADPDDIPVLQDEVDAMLDDGERLVPGFRAARALRVWAGVRPLFQDARAGEVADTRDVSRTHAVVDHRARDGIDGLLTMSGGKLTTLRLMAQDLVDAMCAQLELERPCATATTRPPGNEDGEAYEIGSRLRRREETLLDEQLICECELIGRSRLEATMRRRGSENLDDIRRSLRLGMGPCQGGFCIYRATGILHAVDRLTGEEAGESLRSFLQERWKGVYPILYGDQLRQARLDDWIFQGLLDVEHLPGEFEPQRVARGEAVPHDGGAPDPAQVPEGGRQAVETARELES
jgi:glycerol-3-phosphate dehydrogenase